MKSRHAPPTRPRPLPWGWSLSHPTLILLFVAVVTAFLGAGLGRLRLRTDGHALIPAERAEIVEDAEIRERFGVRDPVIVLVRSSSPEGIYTVPALAALVELSDSLSALAGPGSVMSLATERGDRFERGTLRYRRFLSPLPASEGAIDTLRSDLAALALPVGTLVSDDGAGAAIYVDVDPGAERSAFLARVMDLVARHRTEDLRLDVIGAPIAESLLGLHILADLGLPGAARAHADDVDPDRPAAGWERTRDVITRPGLVPIAIVIMFVVFVVAFRSVPAAVLPLIEVLACLISVLGLMGWMGVPFYLTIAPMPVILTMMGVADEVHLFARHARLRTEDPSADPREVVDATMRDLVRPVVWTSVTTAIGFASFALSPIAPVRAFGVFTALGVMYCLGWSLLVTPALLVRLPASQVGDPRLPSAPLDRLGRLVTGHPKATLGVAGLVVLLSIPGLVRLKVQDSWISGFSERSRFRSATEWYDAHFLGMHRLLIEVRGEPVDVVGAIPVDRLERHRLTLPSGSVSDPGRLVGCRIALSPDGWRHDEPEQRWESWIVLAEETADGLVLMTPRRDGSARMRFGDQLTGVVRYEIRSRTFSWHEHLRRVEAFEAVVASRRDDTVGGVIGAAAHVATADYVVTRRDSTAREVPDDPDRVGWLLSQYGRVHGERRLRAIVDPDLERALVTVFMRAANYRATASLMRETRAYAREHLEPAGLSIRFAGDVAVSQTLIESIVSTQRRSLGLSLVGILVVLVGLMRSPVRAVMGVLPSAMAVGIGLAMLGATGRSLGVSTSMFAGMTLGVGVDFSIHLLAAHARAVGTRAERIRLALADAGPAMTIDALAVALGFGVLCVSGVPANVALGSLALVCILTCLAVTLGVVPALLSLGAGGNGPEDGSSA